MGARYSTNLLEKYNVTQLLDFECYGNSGAACIRLAAMAGARRIVLLGYDCQKTGGKSHWHGDHPWPLGNAGRADRWRERFGRLAVDLTNVEVINCSRHTALTCWPRAKLEDVIC